MARSVFVMVLFASSVLTPGIASAYDASGTHPWIAEKAVEVLVNQYPGQYDEAQKYLEEIRLGVRHEDDIYADGDGDATTLRVMRHFFHPKSLLGLEFSGARFPNSYEWSMTQNELNEWDIEDGRLAFEVGDKESAFFILGHVMHLIADLTVPAHTHLDEHGPFSGDDYEGYCLSKVGPDGRSTLGFSMEGREFPLISDYRELWRRTANAAFHRNLYQGELGENNAGGVLAEMFPELKKNWVGDTWEIPGVGFLGEAFVEVEPGVFYFPKSGLARPAIDRSGFDSMVPEEFNYAPNVSDATMVENMANDLVPMAIMHSALFLKMAMDDYRNNGDIPPLDDSENVSIDTFGGCSGGGQVSLAGLAFLFALSLSLRKRGSR